MRELNENDKTTLQEDAAIYGKRDERGAFEKFKSLKGAAKWEFFRDYFLWKLIAIAAGIVVLVLLIIKIVTPAQTFSYGPDGRVVVKDVELTLIPYYAWCHRGSGEMTVWLPQTVQATTVPNGR